MIKRKNSFVFFLLSFIIHSAFAGNYTLIEKMHEDESLEFQAIAKRSIGTESDDEIAIYSVDEKIEELLQKPYFEIRDILDFPLLVIKKNFYYDQDGNVHSRGEIEDDPFGSAHIFYNRKKETLSGQLFIAGKSYELIAVGKNVVTSKQLKDSLLKSGEILIGDLGDQVPVYSAEGAADVAFAGSSEKYIDLMVVYTQNVEDTLVDVAGAIQTRYNAVNTMLAKSCSDFRFRLVHTAKVAYSESGSILTDLTNLPAGSVANTLTLRDTHGADLVQLWVETNSINYGGLAYRPTTTFASNTGFSVLWRPYSDHITMAHELGHNLGLNHDRYQLGLELTESGDAGIGYGFVDTFNKFQSVMAYSTHCSSLGVSCTRVEMYSSPQKYNYGIPFGLSSYADSASKMNQTYAQIVAYKTAVSGATIPDFTNICLKESENKNVHCFVATAAFGSYLNPYVKIFRNFRDNVLLKFSLGESFVENYYKYSPYWAKKLEESPIFKNIVRFLLFFMAIVISNPFITMIVGLILLVFALAFYQLGREKKKFISFLLIFLLFSIQEKSEAKRGKGGDLLFIRREIMSNPAETTFHDKRYALGFRVKTGSAEKDFTYGMEGKKSELAFFLNGFLRLGSTVFYIDYGLIDSITRTRDLTPTYEYKDSPSSLHFEISQKLFQNLGLGFSYSDLKVYSSHPDINRTVYSGGGTYTFFKKLNIGFGGNYIEASGDSIPDAKWIEAFVSLSLINFGPMNIHGRFMRSPEVTSTLNGMNFAKGEEIKFGFGGDFTLGFSSKNFTKLYIGYEYLQNNRAQVTNYSLGEEKITHSYFKTGMGLMKRFSLDLTYEIRNKKFTTSDTNENIFTAEVGANF